MSDVRETWKYEQGKIVVCRSQDISVYAEAARRVRSNFQRKLNSPLRRVAEIPFIVAEQWMKEGVNLFDRNCAKEVTRRLNSSEWSDLRTSPGKCVVK